MYPQVAERHEYVAFDLDGTLAQDTWPKPSVGAPIPEGIAMLKFYAEQGYCIVIYTARPESHKKSIWKWLKENELFDVVYDIYTDKPVAGLYVDDRAFQFSPEAIVELHKRREGKTIKNGNVDVYLHADDCSLTYTGLCSCRK